MTELALKKKRVTIAFLVAVVLSGLSAYRSMPRAEDPGYTIRAAIVVTRFPGASPQRVEELVTDKLEKAIQEMPEVAYVASDSRAELSIIRVQVKESYDELQPIWDDLRRKVQRVAPDLPDNVIGPTVNDEYGDVFGIILALTGEGFSYAELKDVADDLRDRLLSLRESAKVAILGVQEERIFVEFRDERLAELGLSPMLLRTILQSTNIIIPGGTIDIGEERVSIEPSGNFETLEELAQTVVSLPGRSDLLRLGDLAHITRAYADPPATKLHYNGAPALALAVSLRDGGDIAALGRGCRRFMAEIDAQYPIGIELELVAFEPEVVQELTSRFSGFLQQGGLIAALAMVLFLGLRNGFAAAALFPAAIFMAFFIMPYFDVGLNPSSFVALILVMGIMADHGATVTEMIMERIAAGTGRTEAAVAAGKKLWAPMLIASLVICALFLPFYLTRSKAGEYTGSMFTVAVICLLSSWVLVLTVVPLLCVWFGAPQRRHGVGHGGTRITRAYGKAAAFFIAHRFATLTGTLLIAGAVTPFFSVIPKAYFPPSDRAAFTVFLEFPRGTPIGRVESSVSDLERYLRDVFSDESPQGTGEIVNWVTYIGESGPRYVLTFDPPPRAEYAMLLVNTSSLDVREPVMDRIERHCAGAFPDAVATVQPIAVGGRLAKPIQIRISGPEPDELFAIADEVKALLSSEAVRGPRNTGDDWGMKSKKLVVEVDQARAQRAGITNQDIALSLRTVLSGFELTAFREEDLLLPVTLRSVARLRTDPARLDTVNVYNQLSGRSVPLNQVARIGLVWEHGRIVRTNRVRTLTVQADLAPGFTASQVHGALLPLLEELSLAWPAGYSYSIGGTVARSYEANRSFLRKIPISIVVVLLLLIVQFNSFRKTAVVLLTVPLAFVGAVAGLLIMGSYFGFMTWVGLMTLAGFAMNHALMLLVHFQFEIDDKALAPGQALVEACSRRLGPSLLSALATVGALVPLLLEGGVLWEPVAVTVVFGVGVFAALALAAVPALCAVFLGIRLDEEPAAGSNP